MLEKLLGLGSFGTKVATWFIVILLAFLGGLGLSFSGLMHCPRLFRILGFDRPYISILFATR